MSRGRRRLYDPWRAQLEVKIHRAGQANGAEHVGEYVEVHRHPFEADGRSSHAHESDLSCRPSATDADLLHRPNRMTARPPYKGFLSETRRSLRRARAIRLTGAVYFDFRAELALGRRGAAVTRHRPAGDAGRRARHRVPPDRPRQLLGPRGGQEPSACAKAICIAVPAGRCACACRARRACAARPTCPSSTAQVRSAAASTSSVAAAPSRRGSFAGSSAGRAALQPAAGGAATADARARGVPTATTGWFGTLLTTRARVARARAGRRERPVAAVGADVRRGRPPLSGDDAGRPRPAGSPGCGIRRRPGPGRAARRPGRGMDGRRLASARRRVALGPRRAVHRRWSAAADALPGALAHAARPRLLADGAARSSAVAAAVGYDSEAAFSRAFK